jgi:hypothetical protein
MDSQFIGGLVVWGLLIYTAWRIHRLIVEGK